MARMGKQQSAARLSVRTVRQWLSKPIIGKTIAVGLTLSLFNLDLAPALEAKRVLEPIAPKKVERPSLPKPSLFEMLGHVNLGNGNLTFRQADAELCAVHPLLIGRQGHLLELALILGILSQAKAEINRDALTSEPLESTAIIICPEIVVAGDGLWRAILDPLWLFTEYRHHWSYMNLSDNITLLTTPACESDDVGYRCRGCKDVNKTYYECPHTSMNPRDPCGRQRFEDGQEREFRGICYKIEIRGKTCKVSDEGLNDCRVKTRPARVNPNTGEQEEGTVFRSAYFLLAGEECRESSAMLYTHELWHGCPICVAHNVQMRCMANDSSQRLCERASSDERRRLRVQRPWEGPVMECVDNCNPPSGGNNNQSGTSGTITPTRNP